MTLKFKMVGEHTRRDGPEPLCYSCKYGSIIRGRTFNEDSIHCSVYEKTVRMWVTECPGWHDAKLPTLYEFRQNAWYRVGDEWVDQKGANVLRQKGKLHD